MSVLNCFVFNKLIQNFYTVARVTSVISCFVLEEISLLTIVKMSSRDTVFNIIGAFDIPRYIYSVERKKFMS